MLVGRNVGNGTFAALLTALYYFCKSSFHKSLKFFWPSITSLDPEAVQLPAFSILSAMITGVCGPPEKLSLALVPRSIVWHMIVKLVYKELQFLEECSENT